MSVMQLDLSRQKFYMSPDDPLPQFHPTPRAILVTPIYDTSIPGIDPSAFSGRPEHNQHLIPPNPAPLPITRSSELIGPNPERSQASSSRSHDYRPYEYSPSRDQQYDPNYRDRFSRSYSRDRSRRRPSDDDDSSDNDRSRDDDYSSDDRSSEPPTDYSPEDDLSSDYERSPSRYNHSPSGHNRPPSGHDRSYLDSDRALPKHHNQSSSQPHRLAHHEPNRPSHAAQVLSKLHMYLERNRRAANTDPFRHLRSVPEDMQRILKALPPTHNFCWSQCSGRRKAVCVGINYVGQRDQLKGCANDARHMRSYLMNYREFKSEDILLLTDDGQPASMEPTRKNMFDAMSWLIKDAKMHDSLFFHYSGHGGQVEDKTGTECDGMDEVIFPADFKSTSHIVDNDLYKALVEPLPLGCRLTAIFDSCHSGTVLDLPYLHSAHGRLRSLVHITQRARERKVTACADVICFAGCNDDGTSADTFEGGVAVGAMSYALLKILKEDAANNTNETYGQILQGLRAILIPKYAQKPQLSGTHPVDLDREFTL